MANKEIINGLKEEEAVPIMSAPTDDVDIKKLRTFFVGKFTVEPEFFVRVPGRVNLIGEHIDYCGYSVCPMAIQQAVYLAVRKTNEPFLVLTNVDSAYQDHKCSIQNIQIDVNGIPKWYHYFLCGVLGVSEKLNSPPVCGLQVSVWGTIPPNSGLSSSSALVSAAVLASAKAFDFSLDKTKLADLAACSERYIGTQGGGMDQAIAFLAHEGGAKLISFDPLRGEDIKLPEGAVFVIANCMSEMNKAATADFNVRVVETRLITALLAARMNLDWKRYRNLMSLQKGVGLGTRHFRALATETLHEHPYTKKDICYDLRITTEVFENTFLTENTKHLDSFKLKQRLLHVAAEHERLMEFVRLCRDCQQEKESAKGALWKLGNLMKKSHESLKDLYECSHPDLDKIVKVAEKCTLGARLTGAGWGGCTVALTVEEKVDTYIQLLKDEFYAENPKAEGVDLRTVVFATKPGPGAIIYANL